MDPLDWIVKSKTIRAKRFLERRELNLNQNVKNAMLIKGGNANATVTQVLKDMVCVYFEFIFSFSFLCLFERQME